MFSAQLPEGKKKNYIIIIIYYILLYFLYYPKVVVSHEVWAMCFSSILPALANRQDITEEVSLLRSNTSLLHNFHSV